jgi:hypothetical protein
MVPWADLDEKPAIYHTIARLVGFGFGFGALMLVHEANQPPTNSNDSGDTTVSEWWCA